MSDIPQAAAPRRRADPGRRRTQDKPRPHRLPGLAVPEPRRSARPSPVSRGAGLVLIIDDSMHTRDLYREYLTFRGLGVVTAAEAEAGVAMAHTLKPDVIVMDLAMPGLNGITATHRLKQHPRTRRIPVIVLTGYAFRAIEQGALEAGADVFLTKPCLPEELEVRIRSLVG
jgi:two-component system, cell cycle response regulator DivK